MRSLLLFLIILISQIPRQNCNDSWETSETSIERILDNPFNDTCFICNVAAAGIQYEFNKPGLVDEFLECMAESSQEPSGLPNQVYRVDQLPKSFVRQYRKELFSGRASICIDQGHANPNTHEIEVPSATSLRLLPTKRPRPYSTTGSNTVLVVRVTTTGGEFPELSTSYLQDIMVGTSQNMLSQYKACSQGKSTMIPFTGNNVVNGVLDVQYPGRISGSNITGSIQSALNRLVIQSLGVTDLAQTADHILYYLPNGGLVAGKSDWIALTLQNDRFSYFQHGWVHVGNINFCEVDYAQLSFHLEDGEQSSQCTTADPVAPFARITEIPPDRALSISLFSPTSTPATSLQVPTSLLTSTSGQSLAVTTLSSLRSLQTPITPTPKPRPRARKPTVRPTSKPTRRRPTVRPTSKPTRRRPTPRARKPSIPAVLTPSSPPSPMPVPLPDTQPPTASPTLSPSQTPSAPPSTSPPSAPPSATPTSAPPSATPTSTPPPTASPSATPSSQAFTTSPTIRAISNSPSNAPFTYRPTVTISPSPPLSTNAPTTLKPTPRPPVPRPTKKPRRRGGPAPTEPTTSSPTQNPTTFPISEAPTQLGYNPAFPPSVLQLPGKKGAAYVLLATTEQLAFFRILLLGAYWNYSWGLPRSANQPSNVEFVPMQWGATSTARQEASFNTNVVPYINSGIVKRILAFNEPDHTDQANMSPDAAIALWPNLQKLGIPLCSPSCASPLPSANNDWCDVFMKKIEVNNYRVDYMGVHWYAGPSVKGFQTYMQQVYARYKRPLLITEFAIADWSATATVPNRYTRAQVLAFMKGVLPWLESQSWIYGYVWFPFNPASVKGGISALFDPAGNLTACGRYYQSVTTENPLGDQTITV